MNPRVGLATPSDRSRKAVYVPIAAPRLCGGALLTATTPKPGYTSAYPKPDTATPVSATTRPGACQTTARPSASTTMQTSATLAPPIRSGRCPNAIRVTMNATLNVVSASHAWLQPRSRNSNGTKVVIAAKPTPLNAKATPGRYIARTIAESGGAAAPLAGCRRNGTPNPIVASGRSIVATPTAANPLLA